MVSPDLWTMLAIFALPSYLASIWVVLHLPRKALWPLVVVIVMVTEFFGLAYLSPK